MTDDQPRYEPFDPERPAYHANGSFAGVPVRRIDELERDTVAIVGAPFDWGITHRLRAHFGTKAIREGDYLSADGARPHLTAGVDPGKGPGTVRPGLELLTGMALRRSATTSDDSRSRRRPDWYDGEDMSH